MPGRSDKTPLKRQKKITVSSHFESVVQEIAEYYGIAEVDVIGRMFERGLPIVYREYVDHRLQVDRLASDSNRSIRLLMLRLASGEQIEDPELAQLANDFEVDLEVLKKLRDCLTTGSKA